MARALARFAILPLLVLVGASCHASGSSQGHAVDEGLLGSFDAPFGRLATANAVRVDPVRLPAVTFVPLTLPGVTPIAAWELAQTDVALTYNDPRYGRFGIGEGPGVGDSPDPRFTRFDPAGPIHGRLITNRKGEPAAMSWGTAVFVEWMHDGVDVGIFGAPHGFTQQQAEAVAKALRPTGSAEAVSALKRAIAECRAVVPLRFVNGVATTVGAMHAISAGPRPNHPWRSLFANEPTNAFAAWCWRRTGPRTYQSYAIGPHGEANYLGGHIVSNGEPPPPGPQAAA
jgi:hypothetical protein